MPSTSEILGKPPGGWRLRLHEVIFESDTPAGRRFDQLLIVAILASVAVVLADSVIADLRRQIRNNPEVGVSTRDGFEIQAPLSVFFTFGEPAEIIKGMFHLSDEALEGIAVLKVREVLDSKESEA